jgi:hypothetical protein
MSCLFSSVLRPLDRSPSSFLRRAILLGLSNKCKPTLSDHRATFEDERKYVPQRDTMFVEKELADLLFIIDTLQMIFFQSFSDVRIVSCGYVLCIAMSEKRDHRADLHSLRKDISTKQKCLLTPILVLISAQLVTRLPGFNWGRLRWTRTGTNTSICVSEHGACFTQ